MPRLALLLAFAASAFAQTETAPASRAAESAESIAARIVREVEEIRGIKFDAPAKIGSYTVPELRAYMVQAFERDVPAPRREKIERGLKALGLLPADYDLTKGYLELLTEQVAGFYDPATKELKLVRRAAGELPPGVDEKALKMLENRGVDLDEVTMAHELVHALQDQRFGLRSLPMDVEDDDDIAVASQCVVEGDATVAMIAWSMGRMGAPVAQIFSPFVARAAVGALDTSSLPGGDKLKTCPPYLRESLIFPYVGGLKFCLDIAAKEKAFGPIDAAFESPPRSTEQILHPKKFGGPGRDDPMVLVMPDVSGPLGPGRRPLMTNVLGELGCRVLFENELKSPAEESRSDRVARERAAAKAAAGWDGDRYAVYAAEGAPDVLVWLSTWDSPEDALEACEAAAKVLGADEAFRHAFKNGSDVLFVGPVDAPTAAAVRDLVFEKTTRVERTAAPKKAAVK